MNFDPMPDILRRGRKCRQSCVDTKGQRQRLKGCTCKPRVVSSHQKLEETWDEAPKPLEGPAVGSTAHYYFLESRIMRE